MLKVYSSSNLTTPPCPLLAATLKAFLPHLSEWDGSAPCWSKALTHASWPSWAAIPDELDDLVVYNNNN